jgi:TRAP transporter TAXI family solute receptor
MKKLGFFTLLVCIGVFFSTSCLYAAENWALGSSGAGSGPYVWGGKIAKHINSHQGDLRISSQATAGFNENVELVASGQIQIGLQDASVLTKAYDGTGPFEGHPQKRLRALFTVVVAPYHLVTRADANIDTIYDLKGKKFNIGLPAQGTRVYNEAFLKAAGMTQSDIKVYEMATGQAFKALQDDVIDASGNLFSLGHGRLLELAANTKVHLVSIPDDVLTQFIKDVGGVIKYVIPENVYKGQNKAVTTFGGVVMLFARDDLPVESAYKLTKVFWDNLSALNQDKSFAHLNKQQAYIKDLNVPYHAGALKYFKEKAIAD